MRDNITTRDRGIQNFCGQAPGRPGWKTRFQDPVRAHVRVAGGPVDPLRHGLRSRPPRSGQAGRRVPTERRRGAASTRARAAAARPRRAATEAMAARFPAGPEAPRPSTGLQSAPNQPEMERFPRRSGARRSTDARARRERRARRLSRDPARPARPAPLHWGGGPEALAEALASGTDWTLPRSPGWPRCGTGGAGRRRDRAARGRQAQGRSPDARPRSGSRTRVPSTPPRRGLVGEAWAGEPGALFDVTAFATRSSASGTGGDASRLAQARLRRKVGLRGPPTCSGRTGPRPLFRPLPDARADASVSRGAGAGPRARRGRRRGPRPRALARGWPGSRPCREGRCSSEDWRRGSRSSPAGAPGS